MKRYLRYVPLALSCWPSLSPSGGHKSIPKREDFNPQGAVATSFLSDLLGPFRDARAHGTEDEYEGKYTPRPTQAAAKDTGAQASKAKPPSAPHEWAQKEGAWMCRACLAQSRALHPPAGRCPGRAARIREAALEPKGHNLLYSTFANGEPGIVVICSSCGHYATSNRPCFRERCLGPQSSGAKAHYERVSRGLHPKHARGDAKVFNPLQRVSHLIALRDDRLPSQVP